MRVRDMNWMQVEAYLERDDRAVVPLGSTEQHAQLSLMVDCGWPSTPPSRSASLCSRP